jgi:hypothetical protein
MLITLFITIFYLQVDWRGRLHALQLYVCLGMITLSFVAADYVYGNFIAVFAFFSSISNIQSVRKYACCLHGYGHIFNQPRQKPTR